TINSPSRTSVHSIGSVRNRPSTPRYETRSPPQLLRTARTSKLCPLRGWKGCVMVKTCVPSLPRSAMRAFRQGQGRGWRASCRTLDHCRPTPPEVLSVGRSEPCDSRTARAAEPATVPEARGVACQCVRCGRTHRFAPVARRAVRHEPVVLRASQHRLPHRLRRQLLQRTLHAGARTRGSSSDPDDHRNLSQGTAGSLARPWSWTRTGVHAERTPAEESPSASGVDSLTHGALGRTDRTAHGRVVCTDPRRKTASRDGLSILPRDHSTGRRIFLDQDGSGCRSSHPDRCLPLPEREIDPEELARPTTTSRTATATPSAIA